MLSKASEYGIKAVLHVAFKSQSEERVSLKSIAAAIDSPVAFTGKIMQQLSRRGVVQSIKGPSGGFWMDEGVRQSVTIRDIVEVLDGPSLYTKCALGLNQCNDAHPCPVHDQYAQIRKAVIDMHSGILIDDLARQLEGNARLK
jgi:Rrf2 family protein